jgi:large subunit ribosomal protein L9
MQIILMEKVANLGQLGDIVKVREGYARNYLIPQGKAKRATQVNLAEFEAKRTELERVQGERLAEAQAQAAKLDGLVIRVTQKAGVDGKLFGSVTNIDIAEALKAEGIEVPRASIRMPTGPLKHVGDHTLEVALHPDVAITVTVSVLAES